MFFAHEHTAFSFLVCLTTLRNTATVCPLSPRHGASSGCGWRRRIPATNILSTPGQLTKGGPPAEGRTGLTTSHCKQNQLVTKCYRGLGLGSIGEVFTKF